MIRETNSHVPPRTEQFIGAREACKHFSWSFSMPSSRLATKPLALSLTIQYSEDDGLICNQGHEAV